MLLISGVVYRQPGGQTANTLNSPEYKGQNIRGTAYFEAKARTTTTTKFTVNEFLSKEKQKFLRRKMLVKR